MKNITCKSCKNFDNSNHINDPRTKMLGVCSAMSEIVFLNDKKCKFFQFGNYQDSEDDFINTSNKKVNSLLDIEVIEPIYVLPSTQMSMYEIIDFIK